MKAASFEPSLCYFVFPVVTFFFFCITGQILMSANHSKSKHVVKMSLRADRKHAATHPRWCFSVRCLERRGTLPVRLCTANELKPLLL